MADVIHDTNDSMEKSLTFEKDLRHAITPLSTRLEKRAKVLEELTTMLRLRIDADNDLVRGLQKVMNRMDVQTEESEIGTVKDALDAIKTDIRNEYTARIEHINSLDVDVYKPLMQLKEQYIQNNRRFTQTIKQSNKILGTAHTKLQKVKTKYEKAIQDANLARTQLQQAQKENNTSPQLSKLNAKTIATAQYQQQCKEKYDDEQANWSRELMRYNDEITTILQAMETHELARLQTVGDCLRKWAVFTTNVCANRTYDIQSLAEIMSLVKPEQDLQVFVRDTLAKFPAPLETTNSIVSDELPTGYEFGSVLSRHSASVSLTVERSFDGSIGGTHELSHHSVDIDVINHQDINDIDDRRNSTSSLTKLFTGAKSSRRDSLSVPETANHSDLNSQKTDDTTAVSSGSNHVSSKSLGQLQSYGVNKTQRPKTLKKPRRLVYEPRMNSPSNEEKNNTDENDNNNNNATTAKNSSLVEQPRPIVPPPRQSLKHVAVLSPILDVQEIEGTNTNLNGDTLNLDSSNIHQENHNNNNKTEQVNQSIQNKDKDMNSEIIASSNSISSMIAGEVTTPKTADKIDDTIIYQTRTLSVASATSTSALSAVDSQFE